MKKTIHFVFRAGNACFARKLLLFMKLTTFLLLLSVFQALGLESYSQETTISLNYKSTSLREILTKIEDETEFYFLYSSAMIDVDRKVNVEVEKKSIPEVLNVVFKDLGIRYDIKGRQVLLFADDFQNNHNFGSQQSISIQGKITDSSGQMLPGVAVVVKGTTIGIVTDFDGVYKLSNVPADATLVFSFVGMKTQEIAVNGKAQIDVTMVEDAIGIDEVVAIGYGTMKKSDLTGSVVSVSSEELKDLPNANVLDQVQGRLAGVSIVNTSAAPGANPEILIRGINSITASNNPLIILDGIPYSGSISSINPGDIESFNVLKDASSTAIYGSRGANGVIIITTKKGQTGAPEITYDGKFSVSNVVDFIDVMDAHQYKKFKDDIGMSISGTELENYENANFVNWQELATQTGTQSDHALSIRGGSDKFTYFTSLSRLDQEGVLKGSGFNRTSLRTNGSYFVTDWLEVGTQIQITSEDWGDDSDANINSAIQISPLGTPYDEDGSFSWYPIPEDPFWTNPLANIEVKDASERRLIQTNLYGVIDFPFIKGLSYRLNYGRSEIRSNYDYYAPSTTLAGVDGGGVAQRNNSKFIDTTIENLLNYKREFGEHKVDVSALYSFQEATSDATNTTGSNFINDELAEYGVGTGTNKGISTSYFETALISQMGRINYAYKGKYSLTYTVRRDGYSGFGANEKWGVFSSGALAWTISEEDFLQDINWIDFLKLRTSYGTSGNQAIAPYGTLTRVSQWRSYYLDDTAVSFAPTSLGNPELGWESTATFNVAMDYAGLNGRLSGSIEYYKTSSDGLILSRLLNSTQGFSSILQNVAELENRGVEIELNGKIIESGDFKWNADLTFSHNKNKIVKLFDDETDDVGNQWFIGKELNVNWGYAFDGVFNDQAEVDASHMPDAQPGDAIIRDADGDGELTPDDRTFQGSRNPDYIMGLTNTLTYKNFDFSFFIYSVQGASRVNNILDTRGWGAEGRTNIYNFDYWTPQNPDASTPNPLYKNPYGILYINDQSFVRLKNITLGYNLSRSLIDHLGLSNLRVYLGVNNLFTITEWKGYDPETTGGDLDSYPTSRSIIFGVNVGL
ncbi:TonB-dependent receptor [Sunxiuqinia rutila]|uniref:TonB-dependent receptor n=1 Tax=Sunxiuqinia rutila TaxID=1397841 RepID=UPI003D36ADAD